MHEVFLSKGKVQGSDYELWINSRFNCVLLHPKCHRKFIGTGGNKIFIKLGRYLVSVWGERSVRNWLFDSTGLYVIAGNEALRRFDMLILKRKLHHGLV